MLGADGREPLADDFQVRIGQQLLRVQHFRVRDRGAHVVLHQAFVEQVVVAGRERQHAFIQRRAFVPEP